MAALDAALIPSGRGCPSGLAPAADEGPRADPTAFVQGSEDGVQRLDLLVQGARCAGCIRKIEGALLAMPGVIDARLNLTTGRLAVRWRGAPAAAPNFIATLSGLGYQASAFDPAASIHNADETGRRLLRRLAVAGFAAMNIMMFSVPVWSGRGEMGEGTRALMHWLSALVAAPAALYAAQPFFASALAALRRGRANMDVPISLAVVLTLLMSLFETAAGGEHAYFDGVTMLLFLLLVGRYLDHRLRERARSAVRDLLSLQALTATRIEPDGTARAVAARDIAIGDRLAVAPGERLPVDGMVEEGASELDLAIITGESAPAPVRPGDTVQGGAVNLTRRLVLRAARRAEDSTVAELARLIEMGEQKRGAHMRLADKAVALYVPLVHSLAALTLIGWLVGPTLLRAAGWAADDVGLRTALSNAVAVLIITCPCALGLAVPAVQIVASGRLFRRGVFVKSGDALERLAHADAAVLDKTGTLTLGRPELVNAAAIAPEDLASAAALARASRHPLSRAIVAVAGPGAVAADVVETPGLGLEAHIEGAPVRLGADRFVGAPQGDDHDGAELWLRVGGAAPVRFLFQDKLRPDAAAAVAALQARGLSVELLSGDRSVAVAAAARAAGVGTWRGDASPKDKVARLDALEAVGRKVFMVGDGLNDAPALAAAHVSASPGTAIEASQAAADLVFQGARLSSLVEAVDVARAARRRVIENLAFSALYNLVAAPLAMAGGVTPLIAAVAMSASSLAVTLNALRIAKGGAAWTSPSS